MKNTMKNAIAKYINSKMDLEDEVQFQNDMLALGFTKADARVVMRDIHARLVARSEGTVWWR